jgi:cytochrome b6-f complex iron-sulfur subunit
MASQAASVNEAGSGMTRREFLYYIWGASIVLLTAETIGLLIWSLIPRFREGEFGGRFVVPIDSLPEQNSPPANFADGRFWLSNLNTDQPNDLMYPAPGDNVPLIGAVAIYKVCTHLGCIYSWTPANDRFECPCHGSKYRLDGRRIESPAPRTLDRFKMYALAEDKTTVLAESPLSDDFYAPMEVPDGTAFLSIDTGDKKLGPSQVLLCDFSGTCP